MLTPLRWRGVYLTTSLEQRTSRHGIPYLDCKMNVASLSVALVVMVAGVSANPALKEVFQWKQLDFEYPDEASRTAALASGEFVIENSIPIGVEVWKNKLFVTVPRWKTGIPASLTYINITGKESSETPVLKPYPDWATNKINATDNPTRIVSSFRIRADECDRLWVLDTGIADILGKPEQITLPKILIYDLHTDKLIHQYVFDKALVKDISFFANIVVDVIPGKCDEAFAYVPDLVRYALVVYNLKADKAFRVQHHFFFMDPLSGNYNVGGVNFQWIEGIFGLAVGPASEDGSRIVYFHPLASTMMFSVNSRTLQNETAASSDYYAYKVLGSKGPHSQATTCFVDPNTGILFYTQISKNGIGCWNSFTHPNDFSPDTNFLVASNNETMVYPNDIKVDREGNLWFIIDKLPNYIYKKLDPEETNFRVFKGTVKDIARGTVCEFRESLLHYRR